MDLATPSANKEMAALFFDLLKEQSLDAMFDLIDEDCVIWNPNATYTKAEFCTVASQMVNQTASPFAVEILGMTEEGERVAVEISGSVMLKNGNLYENKYHWLFVVRTGLFVQMREYTDSLPAKLAFNRD
jgi:ketosteroid isomerase-like protein